MSKNRPFQGYTLFQMLKAAKPKDVVSRKAIAKALGVNEGSVPIYFFGLKKYFNVEVETIKDGRSVTGYRLISRDAVVPENGRRDASMKAVKPAKPTKVAKAAKPAKVQKVMKTVSNNKKIEVDDGSVPTLDSDLEISEITDAEMNDLKDQLGLA